ncbi:MAG: thermonuclease family protein [Novosphingobium sp.]
MLGISSGVLIGMGAIYWSSSASRAEAASFQCNAPQVIDGDTLRCGNLRVRLDGIDAPEMPGHCRPGRKCTPGDPFASTESLRTLIGGKTLNCRKTDIDHYGRTVARCAAGEVDLSCAQIDAGQAVRRYGWIWCG